LFFIHGVPEPEGGFGAETEQEVEDRQAGEETEAALTRLPVGGESRELGAESRERGKSRERGERGERGWGSGGGVGFYDRREEQQGGDGGLQGFVVGEDRGVAVDGFGREVGEEAVDVEFKEGGTAVG